MEKYIHMLDRVHNDEKWFHLTKGEAVNSLEEELKKFATKVTFLAAAARPKIDTN